MRLIMRKLKKCFVNEEPNLVLYSLIIAVLITMTVIFVYKTGGTEYAATHLMYMPIILAAYLIGTKGSFAAAILQGFHLDHLCR